MQHFLEPSFAGIKLEETLKTTDQFSNLKRIVLISIEWPNN